MNLFISIIILIIFYIFVVKFFTEVFKGKSFQYQQDKTKYSNIKKHACKCYMEGLSYGEQKVANVLAQELSYKDYFIFNNIITHSKNNISTQIDHIIVSKFGIFVLESKDFSGWIFGDKNQSTWTKSMPGAIKYKFQNPIHQNYGHIMALKELMPFAKDNFYNIVVFSGDAEIKTDPIENVVYLNKLIDYIKKNDKVKLNEDEVQFAVGKLSYVCQTINITEAEHVANIHTNKNLQITNQYNRQPFNAYYK